MTDTPHSSDATGGKNFIRTIIDADLASKKHTGVVTRFPPEPNGYLHIGHAKSICLNFGLAQQYNGTCNLRFDDTNPAKEDMEYVHSIQNDIRWLGFEWGDNLFHASDYFEHLYECAVTLINKGKAYVCSLSDEDIRAYRGTVTEAGRASPYRDRSVEENLELFAKMRAGDFPDGSHTLRAKIDMAAANMKMRDPLLYRIRHVPHDRTGDTWCMYPMYDFAHCLSDSVEGITHSICTLEFENNRELYDWIINETDVPCKPQQIEFARLGLNYTVMSKRLLLELVEDKHVSGWDDPRMPTLAGMRRRGYTPEAIRDFCERIGVAKANSTVDVTLLENSVRNDLNQRAPRVMAVMNPLRVVIDNYPEKESEQLEAASFPHDIPKEGSRMVPFSRTLYIERDDFMEEPSKKFFRLAPGREVRLRYAYLIRCEKVVKDDAGNIVELRCTYDPETRGGNAPDGRKVKGTLHWVSTEHALDAEIRLYDRLFSHENPTGADFKKYLNPDSLEVIPAAKVEPSIAQDPAGSTYQFERTGYFSSDINDSKEGALVFNRTVGLRDSWAKQTQATETPKPAAKEASSGDGESGDGKRKRKRGSKVELRNQARILHPELETKLAHYQGDLKLSEDAAEVLSSSLAISHFFDAALSAHNNPRTVANWVINELLREAKDSPLTELPFEGAAIGELVALIDDGVISGKIAKRVFAQMLTEGGRPEAIVESLGLKQITDPSELAKVIDDILGNNPDCVADVQAGKRGRQGFLVGEVMKATGGRANPAMVNQILGEKLKS